MTLSLTQSATAVTPGAYASFLATGGVAPYTYAVLPSGAGGSINSIGRYTPPSTASSNPKFAYDIIRVTDASTATATARILVGTPLTLFCEIIQQEMSLTDGRVYLWDQKLMQPSDFDLYIAVSVASAKPFGNSNRYQTDGGGLDAYQYVSMYNLLNLDIISRGPAARDRKEEVILALNSIYAQQQQDANSFYIGKLSTNFINLSEIDGAAIPYRYRISVAMQYAYVKIKPSQYFDTFAFDVVTETTEEVDLLAEDGSPLLTEDGQNILV